MGALNGNGFGFPVTFQMTFGNVEARTQNSEFSSSDIPWNIKIPAGYDFFPVLAQVLAPQLVSAGTVTVGVRNGDTDEQFLNMPSPQLTATSGPYATATVGAGACRVPSGVSLAASLTYSGDWTTSAPGGSKAILTIMGYLREAITE